MNKFLLSTLFAIAFCLHGWAQSCLPDGILFSSQFEIDNFTIFHPNCTVIEGNVRIHAFNNNDITNLNGLSGITAIGGNLDIDWAPNLTSLSGLQHVTSIKSLYLDNTALTDLNGLQNLTSLQSLAIRNYFHVSPLTSLNGIQNVTSLKSLEIKATSLTSLNGLQNLTSLEALIIEENPLLTNLNGFPNITTLKDLSINFNSTLTDLSALSTLTTIDHLSVLSNAALQSFSGLYQIAVLKSLDFSSNVLTDLTELQHLTALDTLYIRNSPTLTSLNGLSNITALKELFIQKADGLTDLNGLQNLTSLKNLTLSENGALTNLTGLEGLTTIGNLYVTYNPSLINIAGVENITSAANIVIQLNENFVNLNGLNQLTEVGGLLLSYNNKLTSLSALSNLKTVGGSLIINSNSMLQNLSGLENITSIGGDLEIAGTVQVQNLVAFGNLTSLGGSLFINGNTSLLNLNGLEKINKVNGSVEVSNNNALTDLHGLHHVTEIGNHLYIDKNASLQDLDGLAQLTSIGNGVVTGNWPDTLIGTLRLHNNQALTSLAGLSHLTFIKRLEIYNNPALSACSIFPVCNILFNEPYKADIHDNATDCNSKAEVAALCNSVPVTAGVFVDYNGNCVRDAGDTPVPDIQVKLSGPVQMSLRPTNSNGLVTFGYVDNGPFSLTLPQLDGNAWDICAQITHLMGSNGTDSTFTSLLLMPLSNCPQLTVNLGMPAFFRGCLTTSDLEVSTQNTGTITASGVKAALVMPPVLDLVASMPAVAAQKGDTLYFNLPDLTPFATSKIQLKVKTKCDTVLLGQTLCLETFATIDNACPVAPVAASEIKLSVQCIGDTTVRFTLKNIGNAPTQGWHAYKIIRNNAIQYNNAFQLGPQQSLTYDFPADGATWRMEATKYDDGTETAVALEHCGGLTPGLITAFWLDQGPLEYDFDCRQVIGSYDPNQKTAVPTGTLDWPHIISANHSMQYTIDFQNTGTDTAFRVVLRDLIPDVFDLNTFHPVTASHPYTWEIRGHTLEVTFSPIALPHSGANEPASHGFFSFELAQKPNVPNGTNFENTAAIIFDFNPAIATNTVYHQVGQLTVKVDEPQMHATLWQVLGNPTRDVATFQALEYIGGEKTFTLYDASGRQVRIARFSDQSFDFQRDMLQSGVYFFRITDEQGRAFSGRIVVTD